MTDIRDHAERGGGPEIVLTSDLPQKPPAKIVDAEMVDHDHLTDEGQFPQHGSFIEVETQEGETEYWECAGGLASAIVEMADEMETEIPGLRLTVSEVAKAPSGEWRFVIDLQDPEA